MQRTIPVNMKINPNDFFKVSFLFFNLFSVIIVINVLTLLATAGPILIFDNPIRDF
jgi:hypothetical protein